MLMVRVSSDRRVMWSVVVAEDALLLANIGVGIVYAYRVS
jgi:hypothetical protein